MSKSEGRKGFLADKRNVVLLSALIFMTIVAVVLGILLWKKSEDNNKNSNNPVTPQVTVAPTDTEPSPTVSATPEVTAPVDDTPTPVAGTPTPEATPTTAEISPEPTPTYGEVSPTPEPTYGEVSPTPEPTYGEVTPTPDPSEPTKAPTAAPTATPTQAATNPTTAPTATPTTPATPTPTPAKSTGKTPVADHGRLSVKGTKIVDKNGKEFQLKGVSTHGLQWFPQFVCRETFKCIRDEWGANAVRLAMYTDEGGYCSGGDKAKLKQLVKDGVSYATELGLYVIIDWHILHDYDPNTNKAEAIAFFDEMSKLYKDYDNVFYEICNEPNGGVSWSRVKSYAEEVIAVIRKNDPKGIIIIGTPTWSQDVDIAAKDPVKGYDNLMYALHFYAGTHKDNIRSKMKTAIEAGLPVFVSEYGICDASGNGACNETEANKWVAFMDSYGVSYMIWNLANKNESSSLIKQNCKKLSGFTEADLNQEGRWLVKMLGGKLPEMTKEELEKLKDDAGGSGGGDVAVPDGIEKTVKNGNVTATLYTANTWNETASKCYQLGLTIENAGSSSLNGWTVVVTFSAPVSTDNFWCCGVSIKDKVMTLTPADFNKTIGAGSQTSDIGLIVQSKSLLKIESIEVKTK